MPVLTLYLESDPTFFIRLERFGDLPKSAIGFGSKLRKKVTHYGKLNETSVQVSGIEHEPIQLTGVWDDRQTGLLGRAKDLVTAFRALQQRAQILRLEWDSEVRWGLLDFKAMYTRTDLVNWTIDFTVLYDEPPALIRVSTYKTPPVDQASEALDKSREMSDLVGSAPDFVAPSLLAFMLLKVASIENDITSGLSVLENLTSGVELTGEIARRAAALMYSPLVAVRSMRQRTKNAALETITSVEASGAKAVAVRRWSDDVDALALSMMRLLADLLRRIVEEAKPPSTRSTIVRQGETLMTIAQREYGDFSAWTRIADANGFDSTKVEPGQVIVLPDEVV